MAAFNHRILRTALTICATEHDQNSGVTWGFGSDGSRANQILPFTTLWWAVTGKWWAHESPPPDNQPEDALIAHTRKNALLDFSGNNLGSIQPGKLADLVVLDRDT